MIIKVVRGSYFGGVVDYVTRQGKYAGKGDARVLQSEGLFDHRTFAAQLAFDAARDPKRTRPVVHLIARAERTLTDAQYAELGNRILTVAGLTGRAHIKVVHDEPDDNGHLHLIVCEVDDEGHVPPRILWDRVNHREVSAAEVAQKGAVQSRAWDSQLAWKLTALARKVEVEWGLRQLTSKRAARTTDEPEVSRPQQEHLARTGLIPLQDRFYEEVRSALALPTWDERAAALAAHALVLRPFEAKGRVRGLMVHSTNNSKDAVKVSAFNMGGMGKLDASADRPFSSWHPEYKAAVNLRKTEQEAPSDSWRTTQRKFRLHMQDWQIVQKRRAAAYRQHRLDRARTVVEFEKRLAAEPLKILHRQIRAERAGQLAVINADLDFSLIGAGPKTARPTFADFVVRRAAQGDVAAADVHKDLLAKVSQTRREALDLHKAQIARLAAAAKALRVDAAQLGQRLAQLGVSLHASIEPARQRAARIQVVVNHRSQMTALKLSKKARDFARRLVDRLDRAGHRIRIAHGRVSVDRFQADREARAVMDHPAHLPIFQTAADMQTLAVTLLRDAVGASAAFTQRNGRPVINATMLKADTYKHLRWEGEPEVQAVLADLHVRHERERMKSAADRQAAQAQQIRSMSDALAGRQRKRRQRSAEAADRRAQLVAAAESRPGDSRATAIYLSAWQAALRALPLGRAVSAEKIRTIEVGAIGQLLSDPACFDERIIISLIAARSPARATYMGTQSHGHVADELFRSALQRPEIKQRLEHNRIRAAELAEESERIDVLARMEGATREGFKSDRLWVDLYDMVLSKRRIDSRVTRDERYGAVDHAVAAALLKQGLPWLDVRRSMARLSPLALHGGKAGEAGTAANVPQAFNPAFLQYVDATIDEIVGMMPDAQRRNREAEQQSHRRLVWHSASGWISGDDDVDRGMAPVDMLPGAPPDRLWSIDELDPQKVDMLRFGPDPLQPLQDVKGLFDPDGQPVGPLRELLNDVRESRADYQLGPDRSLVAPRWPADDQEHLRLVQQQPQVRELLVKAYTDGSGQKPKTGRHVPSTDLGR